MQTESCSKNSLQKLGAHLFNFGLMTGLATLTFGLISCGGWGSTTSPSNTTPTITSITPYGMVASSVPKALSILGTNFVNGMTLSITSSSGVPYTITSSSVTSATVLTATVTIPAAPTDNYVTVTVKESSSATASSSAVWGVAGTTKTLVADIQPIFDSVPCYSCHGSAGGLDLSSSSSSSSGLIEAPSTGCSQKFRVKAGDPRRTSSVLIDVLKAKTTTAALACNTNTNRHMPQGTYPALSDPQIQAIIDWIAGGVH